MQKLQETQEKLFQEIKALLEQISSFSTEEELIENKNLFQNLHEKIITLNNFKEINKLIISEGSDIQFTEIQPINFEIDTKEIQNIEDKSAEVEEILEGETPVDENIVAERIDDEYFMKKEQEQNQLIENSMKELVQESTEISLAQTDIERREEEERLHIERRKILEIEKPLREEKPKNLYLEERQTEKKFKLANIKGLKSTVQSLFDEDPLEKIEKESYETQNDISTLHHKNEEIHTQSLIKSNVPTDFMEAEKSLPDFRLDINDKLAFTKMLFGGSQVELNQVVTKLNSFKTIDEAKAYLSEVYYERNWEKADEYAQRLWSLVENKFL